MLECITYDYRIPYERCCMGGTRVWPHQDNVHSILRMRCHVMHGCGMEWYAPMVESSCYRLGSTLTCSALLRSLLSSTRQQRNQPRSGDCSATRTGARCRSCQAFLDVDRVGEQSSTSAADDQLRESCAQPTHDIQAAP